MTFSPVSQVQNAERAHGPVAQIRSGDERIGAIAQVAAAFAARSDVDQKDIVALVHALGEVFAGLDASETARGEAAHRSDAAKLEQRESLRPIPVIPLEKCVTEDRVYCLCCGQGFSMLKRHLKSQHGLSEEQYRELYSLPRDMPLVAPSYSRRKAAYAKSIGLGGYRRESSVGKVDRLLS